MSIQNFVDTHQAQDDWCILQVDMKNAFNTLDRQKMLEACLHSIPQYTAWVYTCYGQHSPLFLGSQHTIASAQGVQQGDPLGPLLFSITLQSIITKLPPSLPCNIWYLDDGHIIMPASDVQPICSALNESLPTIGLHLNLKKCRLWGPSIPSLSQSLPPDSIIHNMSLIPFNPSTGIMVLGTPVEHPSTSSYRQASVQSVVENLKKATHLLSRLGNPQTAHLLLRYCLDACRLQHLLRSTACEAFPHTLGEASAALRDTVAAMLGQPLTDTEWAQCQISIRLGGLGIRDPVTVLPVARTASIISYLHKAPSLHILSTPPSPPPDTWPTLLALNAWINQVESPLPKWLEANVISAIEPEHCSQRWWALRQGAALVSALKSSLNERDRARFALQSQPHAGQWMSPPAGCGPYHAYSPREYRLLLRWWLGSSILPDAWSGSPCPFCQTAMDPKGDHLVSCHRNGLTERHHRLRDSLYDLLHSKGIPVLKEQLLPGSNSQERPADIYLPQFDAAGPLYVDCFIEHPLSLSRSRLPATALQQVGRHEKEKIDRYQQTCTRNGASFCPWGMSTWGGYGPKGGALVFKLIRHIVGDLQGQKRSLQICKCRYSISTAVMVGIAAQLSRGVDWATPPPAAMSPSAPAPTPHLPHPLLHHPHPFSVVDSVTDPDCPYSSLSVDSLSTCSPSPIPLLPLAPSPTLALLASSGMCPSPTSALYPSPQPFRIIFQPSTTTEAEPTPGAAGGHPCPYGSLS